MIYILIVIILLILLTGVRVINQYERGVVFRLGRISGKVRGPGLIV
jgi:regulator of protease activity HflC (stomatin/prohibitin superfamily)